MSNRSFNLGKDLVKTSGWGQSLLGAASTMIPGGNHLMTGYNAISNVGQGNFGKGLSGITDGSLNKTAPKPMAKPMSQTRALGAPSTKTLA